MNQVLKHSGQEADLSSGVLESCSCGYVPPAQILLEVLGVKPAELNSESTKVSTAGLKYLVSEFLAKTPVDEVWYLEKYPDVRAGVLSGDVKSAAQHFRTTGYLEGRLPRELPFDPEFYFAAYDDLANVFSASDEDGLRRHFETSGFEEGRAGVQEHFADAERWRAAPNS